MLSPAAVHDRQPHSVVVWRDAVGLDGEPFEIPAAPRVASGTKTAQAPARHYALVCRSEVRLTDGSHPSGWIDDEHLRNLRTGATVGASQVTAVVRHAPRAYARRRYRVAFTAELAAPYQVVFNGCEPA